MERQTTFVGRPIDSVRPINYFIGAVSSTDFTLTLACFVAGFVSLWNQPLRKMEVELDLQSHS